MTDAIDSPRPRTPRGPRPWLRAFLLASAVFASGLIVGVVLTSTYLWHRAIKPPPFMIQRMLNEMQSELGLTPDQLQQLNQIFSSHRERMTAIHDEVQPKVAKELESLDARVAGILTPDQATQWNARFNEMKERWLPPPRPEPGAPPGAAHPGLGGPRPEPPGPHGPQFGPRPPGMPGPPPGQRGPLQPGFRPQQPGPMGPPPGQPGEPLPGQRGLRQPGFRPQWPGPLRPPPGQPSGPAQGQIEPMQPGPGNPPPPPEPPSPPPPSDPSAVPPEPPKPPPQS